MNRFLTEYSKEELQALAELQQLRNLFEGDESFRQKILHNSPGIAEHYHGLNISIDPEDLASIWENTRKIYQAGDQKPDITWTPLEKLWLDYQAKHQRRLQSYADRAPSPLPRLNAWRKRRIKRAQSETGMPGSLRIFPLFAYELSKGCSINCWFCGFSAGKFEGCLPYTEQNALLWKNVLEAGLECFGDPARSALCYHATEPFDNPDYLKFLQAISEINGILPQTTTAAPLKDIDQTLRLLEMRRAKPDIFDRFSILADGDLIRIFETFSPLELLHTEMVHHNPGGLANKAYSGRAFKMKGKAINRVPEEHYRVESGLEQRTVECLLGFLVNLVDRSIQLVAPCMADDEWPKGYRVLKQGIFRDIGEYKAFLDEAVEECMPEKPGPDCRIAFRSDLDYRKTDDGFVLISYSKRHRLRGQWWHRELGDMIHAGNLTCAEITAGLRSPTAAVEKIQSALDDLFEAGLLDE